MQNYKYIMKGVRSATVLAFKTAFPDLTLKSLPFLH